MAKRLNPYSRLLEEIKDFCVKIRLRNTVLMWYYPIDELNKAWNLDDLWQRTIAADQLGFEVHLVPTERGLEVKYVKKLPQIPFEWKY